VSILNLRVDVPTSEIEGFLRLVRSWQMQVPRADVSIRIERTELDSQTLDALVDHIEPGFSRRRTISTPDGRHLRTTLRG
jgi:hypothetical protein